MPTRVLLLLMIVVLLPGAACESKVMREWRAKQRPGLCLCAAEVRVSRIWLDDNCKQPAGKLFKTYVTDPAGGRLNLQLTRVSNNELAEMGIRNSTIFHGRVAGEQWSDVHLTVGSAGKVVLLSIHTEDGRLIQLEPMAGGRHVIYEVDQDKLPKYGVSP